MPFLIFLGTTKKECTVLAHKSVLLSSYFSACSPQHTNLFIRRNLWKRCSDLNRTVQIMSSSEGIVFFVWFCLTSMFWTSATSTTNDFIYFNHRSTDWMKRSDSFSFNTIESTSSFSTFWVFSWSWNWTAWTLTLRKMAKNSLLDIWSKKNTQCKIWYHIFFETKLQFSW